MSKLLIQESPLTFQPSLAVAIGLNEAIVLQQIHYWINNTRNKGYEQDGFKWVYNTYAEWRELNFPFWSENTIQRTFASLEEKGLVISIQPMKGKYDRTKYYRIDYPKLDVFDDPNLVCSLNESETNAENTQPDFSLSSQDLAEVNAKVDYILESQKAPSNISWRGREFLPPHFLEYGDWFYEKTGLEMYGAKSKAKQNSSWMKAFKDWWENEITPAHLQIAYDAQKAWRMVSDPNQLTKDAVAIKAAGLKVQEPQEPKFKDGSGYV